MHGGQQPGEQRLNLLDGLRGIAAIVVVLCHYKFFFLAPPNGPDYPVWNPVEPARAVLGFLYDYGYRGVELFWLISGFVFTHVYCTGKPTTARAFFLNRFARLYPLHLLTLIVVALLQSLAVAKFGRSPIYVLNDGYHFVLNLTMTSAWGFERGPSFNQVIWSVSVEIAIYALFWVVHRRLSTWLGAAALAGLCGFVALLGPPNFIFACGFYFFAGSALAWLRRDLAGLRPRATVAVIIALAGVGAFGLVSRDDVLMPMLGLTGSYAALVLLLVEWDGRVGAAGQRLARWLGECSYGIYLWHFPVMLAAIVAFAPAVDFAVVATQGWCLALYLASVLGMARLSYVCFERPARNRLRWLSIGLPGRTAQPVHVGG